MTEADKRAFITEVEKQHGQRLRRFVVAKLQRRAAEAPDVVQEVFLRLLRVAHHGSIRSSEAPCSPSPSMCCIRA